MKQWSLSFILCFFLSLNLYAQIVVVPEDDDVMVKINSTQQQHLYPFGVNILVWNIYKGSQDYWEQEFFNLAQNKALLLLQEGYLTNDMLATFAAFSDYSFLFATTWINQRTNQPLRTGVVTASTTQAESLLWQRSHYREPILNTPKMTLFTRYKIAGRKEKLLVGNIHGINFVRTFKLTHMLKAAKKIIEKHRGPVLFAGDFNTWSRAKMRAMNKVFKSLKMQAASFSHDERKSFRGNILDHVWLRDIEVLDAVAPKAKSSDHAPMVLSLNLL